MSGKHGKYAYVEREDGWYVKVRVFKNKAEDDPERYLPVGPKVRSPPFTFQILKEKDLPEETREKLYQI